MSKYLIIGIFLLVFMNLEAQINKDTIDSRYLEDQIYLSLTYNILFNKPSKIAQNGFSGGFSIGFIKDIPLNEKRNVGLGIGLGYSYNAYIQNLKIFQENNLTLFETAEDFNTNKFITNSVELPLELRWRNSTAQRYKFWRVYGGVKLSYILSSKTTFTDNIETLTTKNISEFEKFQYGLTLATGYSTWNLFFYYGLNSIFQKGQLNGENISIKDFNVGLKFYIM